MSGIHKKSIAKKPAKKMVIHLEKPKFDELAEMLSHCEDETMVSTIVNQLEDYSSTDKKKLVAKVRKLMKEAEEKE